jgi:hypothetical protein
VDKNQHLWRYNIEFGFPPSITLPLGHYLTKLTFHAVKATLRYKGVPGKYPIHVPPFLELRQEHIIEIYVDKKTGKIDRFLARVTYTKRDDLCLVMKEDGTVITVYLNPHGDAHVHLNAGLYTKPGEENE